MENVSLIPYDINYFQHSNDKARRENKGRFQSIAHFGDNDHMHVQSFVSLIAGGLYHNHHLLNNYGSHGM